MKVSLQILLKIDCHGNVTWGIGKLVQIDNRIPFISWKKIMKIGPVDAEIPLLNKKEIMKGKIYMYSLVAKFA